MIWVWNGIIDRQPAVERTVGLQALGDLLERWRFARNRHQVGAVHRRNLYLVVCSPISSRAALDEMPTAIILPSP